MVSSKVFRSGVSSKGSRSGLSSKGSRSGVSSKGSRSGVSTKTTEIKTLGCGGSDLKVVMGGGKANF